MNRFLSFNLPLALAALLICLPSFADGPFRSHRYDAINVMPVHEGDIVFVGNSITNMHEWWEAFGCRQNILNRGVSGCFAEETLRNIGPIVAGHPSKVFLMVGTNDIAEKKEAALEEVMNNVSEIVRRFKTESPQTEIYIESILPVAEGNARPAQLIIELNSRFRKLCESEGLTYVDIWSAFVEPGTTHINPAYTADGLHPYPSGYKAWCDIVSQYIDAECVYKDFSFDDRGLGGSFAMRCAAFSRLPLVSDDIVLIGDEMINSGEWHELLGSPRVKNRGSWWGFGGPSIDQTAAEIPAIFASGASPEQIYLHVGAAEVSRNTPVDTIIAHYRGLVSAVKAAAPSSRLFLMTPQPVYPSHNVITPQKEVNAALSGLADEVGATFVDIFTPLCAGGEYGNTRYVKGNYVYGEGYLVVSRVLASYMGLECVPVLKASRDNAFTGRGNKAEKLMTLSVSPSGKFRLRKMEVALSADAGDVTALKVVAGGKVVGSAKVRDGKKIYKIRCRRNISDFEDIDLCADIAPDAAEGAFVSADITRVRKGWKWCVVEIPAPGGREILLARTKILGAGDYGSVGYRIPAIITLGDGSLLITSDKRKHNDLDLPEDIDVIAQKSTDGGRSWTDPVTIVEGRGFNKGYGDAALVESESGDVFCAFSGGTGIWASTLEHPQRNYICKSSDGGLTWSEPFDCTFDLWGPSAANPECRDFHSAFFASGRGLRLEKGAHKGRIMFVAAVHSLSKGRFDNYVYYSDDEGVSWKVSKCAFEGGDEAKVVELPDGRVLLSVRRSGERGWNISEDGGETWGKQGLWKDICVNACDGDILALGDSLLIHSVPNAMTRRNVSIFISRDGGISWPESKSLCHYESVYSALTILPDGTIGAYIEENPNVEFDMYFLNFSVDWLLK